MDESKLAAALELTLGMLEELCIKHAKGQPLPESWIKILEDGWHLLGNVNYKVADPSKECQVCATNLDGQQIICDDCFADAFKENFDEYEFEELDGLSDETPKRYTRKRYLQFVADMANAGILVREYNGRYSYSGPAVYTAGDVTAEKVARATDVSCQTDTIGLDFIIYPR